MQAPLGDQTIDVGPAGLTEPTFISGSIQPHGALLALDPDNLRIVHTGGDTARFLGVPAKALLSAAAADVLPPPDLRQLQRLLDSGRSMVRPVWAFDMPIEAGAADV